MWASRPWPGAVAIELHTVVAAYFAAAFQGAFHAFASAADLSTLWLVCVGSLVPSIYRRIY